MDGIHTGLHIATNQLSPVPKASLCRDVQTHTHTHLEGWKYATYIHLIMLWSFLPDALVIPGSRDSEVSLGTYDNPQSGWRRMEDVPWWL